MTRDDARRRIGALSALAAGLFVGLTLLPLSVTGPVGGALGQGLWRYLGAGALGFPLLGVMLALAGFGRLGPLDMKRTAALVVGLSVLVPYLVGALARLDARALDAPLAEWSLTARLVGIVPGFLESGVRAAIGVAGAALVGFVAISALTLVTVAWHPLQRLEGRAGAEVAGSEAGGGQAGGRGIAPREADEEGADDEDDERPAPVTTPPRVERKPAAPRAKPVRKADGTAASEDDAVPPIELLAPPPRGDVDAGEAQLDRLQEQLLDTLRTFKVEGTIAGRTTGPVVTQFEVVPAPGVKAQRIVALADDLAITMRATSIRVAPIPGKGAVGVEVPNPKARMVTLRELFEAPDWDDARAMLPVALGRDLEGRPVLADLAKMPHLLIAGATGSGKSVAVNTIITSLIYRYGPKRLRLLLIDPKMVELSMYNRLPHLRAEVVTDSRDAARVLKWAVKEMNLRYALLQANGARNLADFNAKVATGKPLKMPGRPRVTLSDLAQEPPDTPPPPAEAEAYTGGALPLIVLVIDELADLMMQVQAEVETPLAMLAQKARAIGIHLILATQRPSVNVITGLIKANFPSRIAFRVASKVDSRTILDQNGAEALLGNGDMLFLPPGKSEPMRVQGAFIGTEETERVMDWYEHRGAVLAGGDEPDILALMRADEAEDAAPDGEPGERGERDPRFREAAELCIQHQGGSTSLLQRRMGIGYGRAARIIDQLVDAGILGESDSTRKRDVRISLDQLDAYTQ